MRSDNHQNEVRIKVTSAPATEPVTLTEIKAHLRVDHTADDTLLGSYIQAARETIESWTARRMITRTEKLFLQEFPASGVIVIPAAPVSAVTAINVLDEELAATPFAATNYVVDLNSPLARVALKFGACWPTLSADRKPVNPIEVTFTSGYANAAAVPETLKTAVKLLVGHFYENREDSTPLTVNQLPVGVRHLIAPYRVWEAIL